VANDDIDNDPLISFIETLLNITDDGLGNDAYNERQPIREHVYRSNEENGPCVYRWHSSECGLPESEHEMSGKGE